MHQSYLELNLIQMKILKTQSFPKQAVHQLENYECNIYK